MGINIVNGVETLTNPMYVHLFNALGPFTPNANATAWGVGNTALLPAGSYLGGWSCAIEFASMVRNYETYTLFLMNATTGNPVDTSYFSGSTIEIYDSTFHRFTPTGGGIFTLTAPAQLTLGGETNGANPATTNSLEVYQGRLWLTPVAAPTVI